MGQLEAGGQWFAGRHPLVGASKCGPELDQRSRPLQRRIDRLERAKRLLQPLDPGRPPFQNSGGPKGDAFTPRQPASACLAQLFGNQVTGLVPRLLGKSERER